MRLTLSFLLGAAFACFLIRSAASALDWQAKYVLKNYGLIFLFLAAVALAGVFGHEMGWN